MVWCCEYIRCLKKITDEFDCHEKFVDVTLKEGNTVLILSGCRLDETSQYTAIGPSCKPAAFNLSLRDMFLLIEF